VRGDIFETDFSDATVVTTFLLPSMNLRLRPRFLAMKPGTRIVANTFAIGDWEPDETRDDRTMRALVQGDVVGGAGARRRHLAHAERHPRAGAASSSSYPARWRTEPIENGRLRGDEISFTVGATVYRGHVEGPRMRVSADDGPAATWVAMVPPRAVKKGPWAMGYGP
jgi:hypothetical protein